MGKAISRIKMKMAQDNRHLTTPSYDIRYKNDPFFISQQFEKMQKRISELETTHTKERISANERINYLQEQLEGAYQFICELETKISQLKERPATNDQEIQTFEIPHSSNINLPTSSARTPKDPNDT